MTIQEILTKATQILNEHKIEEARLTAKLLLSYILKCKKEDLIIRFIEEINEKSEQEFLNRNRKNS